MYWLSQNTRGFCFVMVEETKIRTQSSDQYGLYRPYLTLKIAPYPSIIIATEPVPLPAGKVANQ